MGEVVRCELEERNAHDPFAVAVKKAGSYRYSGPLAAGNSDPSFPCYRAQKSLLV